MAERTRRSWIWDLVGYGSSRLGVLTGSRIRYWDLVSHRSTMAKPFIEEVRTFLGRQGNRDGGGIPNVSSHRE